MGFILFLSFLLVSTHFLLWIHSDSENLIWVLTIFIGLWWLQNIFNFLFWTNRWVIFKIYCLNLMSSAALYIFYLTLLHERLHTFISFNIWYPCISYWIVGALNFYFRASEAAVVIFLLMLEYLNFICFFGETHRRWTPIDWRHQQTHSHGINFQRWIYFH